MMKVLVLFLAAVLAVPNYQSLISIPVYKTPSKKSIASYIRPIDMNMAYEMIVQVTADSYVVHVSNLPTDFVSCNQDSLTIGISDRNVLDSWPEMSQMILWLDDQHHCPHAAPIYFSNSWKIDGSSIKFDTVLARRAGVDAEIKIVVRPSYLEDLYANSGYDGYDFDDESDDEIGNRTKVYPYKFNYNINRMFDIGSSGAFLNCEPCRVQGELDIVMTAQGTILNDFQLSSYISGSVTGSFKLGAGILGKTASDRITLLRYSLPEIELPGIFYLAPSFSVYGVTTLDSDQDVTVNVGMFSNAKNFHVTLMSIGHRKNSTAQLDNISDLETKPSGLSSVNIHAPFEGNVDFGLEMSIRPQLELRYKVMGYPSSSLMFAVDTGIQGTFQYMRTGDVCPNHILGSLDARSSLMADIGFKKIMKEGTIVKLFEGCVGRK